MPTIAPRRAGVFFRRLGFLALPGLACFCASVVPLSAKVLQATYAQRLVDLALLKNPELVVVAMHVTAPGSADNAIVAANRPELIGEKSDPDDLAALTTNRPTVTPTKDRTKYEVILPLRNVKDETIGTLVIVTHYEEGAFVSGHRLDQAAALRDQLAQVIPSLEDLFEPYDLGCEPNASRAQKITVAAAVRHPDMLVIALHLKAPGEKDYKIWATNRPKVMGSSEPDESDTNVAEKGHSLWTYYGQVHRMLAEVPLRAADGSVCGALVTVALARSEDDMTPFVARALALRDEVQCQIPGHDALFRP
jgi:hypothetical protein